MSRSPLLALLLAAGCGGSPAPGPDGGGADLAPAANVYTPFSAANYQAQQFRVGLYEELAALPKTMGFDKTRCGDPAAPTPGSLAEIYTRNDPKAGILRDKVKGRTDDHAYNKGAAIGVTMDELISRALVDCKDGKLPPAVAAQIVEKNLQWFFYASVYHELTLGSGGTAESPAKWDEAFGYYGRTADGAESRGISGTAKKRDDNFKLTLNDTIFRGFIDGRAQLAAKDSAALARTVDKLDQNLLAVFAYSAAREFVLLPQGPDSAVLLAEGIAFFNVLEPYLRMAAPADAAFIRDQLKGADYAKPTMIDHAGIVSRLEKAFGIKVTK